MTAPHRIAGLQHVPRNVLSDSALGSLRRAIVSGEIAAGARLRETELAEQMNVSRGPIREALLRLEQEGLVVLERHRGARVAVLSLDDREKIYSVRLALEQVAVEYACANADEADLVRIESVLQAFVATPAAARTPAEAAEWDIQFHDAVYLAAHNEPLYRAWEGMRSQVHYFLTTRMMLRPDYNEDWEQEHRHLLELLVERDPEVLVQTIRSHIRAGYERSIAVETNASVES